jgi:hypothetical protein
VSRHEERARVGSSKPEARIVAHVVEAELPRVQVEDELALGVARNLCETAPVARVVDRAEDRRRLTGSVGT